MIDNEKYNEIAIIYNEILENINIDRNAIYINYIYYILKKHGVHDKVMYEFFKLKGL